MRSAARGTRARNSPPRLPGGRRAPTSLPVLVHGSSALTPRHQEESGHWWGDIELSDEELGEYALTAPAPCAAAAAAVRAGRP